MTEKIDVNISNLGNMVYPEIGKPYEMTLTHIVNVEEFYAQIPALHPRSLQTLGELQIEINSLPMKSGFVPFTEPPVEQELVLGLYTDNQWYRAKVLNVFDDDAFKIFFIDYGNCRTVSLTDLRKWDVYFNFLPPQALHCRLNNVKLIKIFDLEANRFFREISSKPVIGKVLNNFNKLLYVTLMDLNGFDIGKQICTSGYGHPRSTTE